MRLSQALAIVVCVGLLSVTSPINLGHAAPVRNAITTIAIVMGPTTKVTNKNVQGYPNLPISLSFDDAQWGHPVAVAPDIAACVRQQTGSWPGFPVLWGADTSSWYWLRQHFYSTVVICEEERQMLC